MWFISPEKALSFPSAAGNHPQRGARTETRHKKKNFPAIRREVGGEIAFISILA
ncbi:hypothetical protein I656_02787 [Geobacillus sp. WSUCF1]|nr:hypothetical protein I656_02787 [Geobacillus sp. WSUCF1]